MNSTKRLTDRLLVLTRILILVSLAASPVKAQRLPDSISNSEFWRLITELSEPAGRFPAQLMSNEDSALFVMPALREATRPGGAYIGVGSEQNFTYIAATQPDIVFVVDIRRANMLQHLLYKALFELSADRADFVSRLFSIARPAGIDTDAGAGELFEAFRGLEGSEVLLEENVSAVLNRLVSDRELPLAETDRQGIAEIMSALHASGPHALQGFGDRTNPTYAQLMAATDLDGTPESYLATEERFRIVQEMERRNLIVPLVGDFAGERTIPRIGSYLMERNAIVAVFYVSNVERYLFDQGESGMRFYSNVRGLPVDATSIFIRSVTSDISYRLDIPIPDQPAKWRTFLSGIRGTLDAFEGGEIQSYRDLFVR